VSTLLTIGLILLAWLLLLPTLLLAGLAIRGWRARKADRRVTRDRRVGMPDTRPVRVERRSGFDRRGGGSVVPG
jgi:hypothetical protein